MSCMDDIPSRCRLGDGNHPVIGFFLIQCIYICVCLGIANTRWMIMLAIGSGLKDCKWHLCPSLLSELV